METSRFEASLANSGEKRDAFCTTRWTLVEQAARPASEEQGRALSQLCEAYWYPLYAYARRRNLSVESAQDQTQGFFYKLLEKNYIGAVNQRRGRFRWFLLAAFKCHLANEWDRSQAEKRGGGFMIRSWEECLGEERYQLEADDRGSADQLYDRGWALGLVDQARFRVRTEYEALGKGERYAALESCLPGRASPESSQSELAEALGLSEGAVKQEVYRLKRRFAEALRAEVAKTVGNEDEVDEELRYLVDVLCRR